jgi:sugar lactone lactonase YvrE
MSVSIATLGRCIVTAMLVFSASSAAAQFAAVGDCESGKGREAGKFAACVHRAEARLAAQRGSCSLATMTSCYRDADCPPGETCLKDPTSYDKRMSGCEASFDRRWDALEAKAAPDQCPDGLLSPSLRSAVEDSVARVTRALTGSIVHTFAGSGVQGDSGDGGPAVAANLYLPGDIDIDGPGNVFFAVVRNHRVQRVDIATGIITTVAGTGVEGNGVGLDDGDGGLAVNARLARPRELARDPAGNLYFVELNSNRLRMIEAHTGIIHTIAGGGAEGFSGDGGPAAASKLARPHGVAIDGGGNIFIADFNNHRIRRIDAATGNIATIAGSGTPTYSGDGGLAVDASVNFPAAGAFDPAGNYVFCDAGNRRVRRIDLTTGVISTVAGNGVGTHAGDGGLADQASFVSPQAITYDGEGNLYIADAPAARVRRVDAVTGVITTIAGTGVAGFSGDGGLAIDATFNNPRGLAVDRKRNRLYVADGVNERFRMFDLPLPGTD